MSEKPTIPARIFLLVEDEEGYKLQPQQETSSQTLDGSTPADVP